MAKGGHTPDWPPTAREAPLGRRTFAHWPHTAGSHSLAKRGGGPSPTGPLRPPLREVASPLTGQRRDGRP